MFNLFPRLSKQDNEDRSFYTGQTISFNQLIENIRSINPVVNLAREHGKGTDLYDQIKKTAIPVFFANGYNEKNNRSTKSFFKSTGYIYVDLDFDTVGETLLYKNKILLTRYQFIAACWTSLSGCGLSILIKVNPDRCNKYQYLKYWDILNELFEKQIDLRTRDFYRLVCVSSDPDVYVNANAIAFDTLYQIDYEDSLIYRTQLPLEQFKSLNQPVLIPDGVDSLTLDFYKYKSNKVKAGNRTSTIGAISLQLIYLNPRATKKQLLNALMSFNRNYCKVPLTEKEVSNILSANLKKQDMIDVTRYTKKKYVFFHPNCKLPLHERQRIKGDVMTKMNEQLVNDGVHTLLTKVKPNGKITVNIIAEFIGQSKTTVYKYLSNHSKANIERYHENVPFSADHIYTLKGYNMSQTEKGTFEEHTEIEFRIYEALEDLQDGLKITQQRVADYIGINVKTVKRNWLPQFKELVKGYNQDQNIEQPSQIEEYAGKRDILSPLPDDESFDWYVNELVNSKFYYLNYYRNAA